jgi:hypothetical protein
VFSIAVVALHFDFGIHEGMTAALCVKLRLLQLPLQGQVMVAHQKSLHEPSPNATQSARPPSVNPSPATPVRWSNACGQPARRDESWFAFPESLLFPTRQHPSRGGERGEIATSRDGMRRRPPRPVRPIVGPLERPALGRKGWPA